jgi:hypothetical protein
MSSSSESIESTIYFLVAIASFYLLSPPSKASSKPSASSSSFPPQVGNNKPLSTKTAKQVRYANMLPQLIMKKKMYDNVRMHGPDGTFMTTISKKKGDWYIRKGLAVEFNKKEWDYKLNSSELEGEEEVPPGIRLKFEPKKPVYREDAALPLPEADATDKNKPKPYYEATPKSNSCVSCDSSDEGYMRHHIVPSTYRTLFPKRFKSHLSHDIVILCPNCHVKIQGIYGKQMSVLEARVVGRVPVSQRHRWTFDREAGKVKSAATALSKYRSTLPSSRVLEFEDILRSHYGLDDDSSLSISDDIINNAMAVNDQLENPLWVSPPTLLINSLEGDETKLRNFVISWRSYFIAELKPKYMPEGWDVNYKVMNERNESDDGSGAWYKTIESSVK